jgi:hypothetical protein|tara:strand:- start:1013 stop:3127 length:2115 start_codon:yes stop_codon:yes gene_type:complete
MADEATHYPLTDEGRIAFWTNQIEVAEKFFQPFFEAGTEIVKMYNNMATTNREERLDQLDQGDNVMRTKASFVFAWVDQSVSTMVGAGEPSFDVKAKRKASSTFAPVVANNINYWWGETGQPAEDEQCTFDAHCMPWAVKKIGWEFEEEVVEELVLLDLATQVHEDPTIENGFLSEGEPTKITREQDHAFHIAAHEDLMSDEQINPDIRNLIVAPHIARHKEYREGIQPRPSSRVKWQAPFGIRWNPGDFLMDPWASAGLADARWIAFRIRQPVYRWQADKALKNTEDLKPNAKLPGGDPAKKGGIRRLFSALGKDEEGFSQFGIAEGWEIWARDFPVGPGKRRNVVLSFVPDHDKLLRHEEEWPYKFIEDYPCEILHFQQNMQTWVNKPLLSLAGADNMQVLVNEFLDSMLYTMRKSKNVLLVDKDAWADNSITNLKEAPEGAIIPVEGLAASNGRAIQAAPFLEINSDKTQMLSLIRALFDETAGTAQPLRGNDPDTATEAAIIERRTAAREGRRQDRFEKFQINTARKFWQLQQQFMPDTGDLIDPRTGAVQQVTKDIAQGEYLFDIQVSGSRESQAVAQKQAMDRLNLSAGLLPIMAQTFQMVPNLPQMLEDVFRASGIKDVDRYLPGNPDDVTEEVNRQIKEDPQRRMEILASLQQIKSPGGAAASGGVGPIDSQSFAANPATPARANAQAGEADEGGQ